MAALMSFYRGVCQPGTHEGESTVTVPDGSVASKMPNSASRIERTNSCVPTVRSAEGGNWRDWILGMRRVSSVLYSTCILAEKPAENWPLMVVLASSAKVWRSLLPRDAVARGSGQGARSSPGAVVGSGGCEAILVVEVLCARWSTGMP